VSQHARLLAILIGDCGGLLGRPVWTRRKISDHNIEEIVTNTLESTSAHGTRTN
jgi:hypothetical protein